MRPIITAPGGNKGAYPPLADFLPAIARTLASRSDSGAFLVKDLDPCGSDASARVGLPRLGIDVRNRHERREPWHPVPALHREPVVCEA